MICVSVRLGHAGFEPRPTRSVRENGSTHGSRNARKALPGIWPMKLYPELTRRKSPARTGEGTSIARHGR